MIKDMKTNERSWLSHVPSRLVDSVSQLSHVFHRFAAKYPTTNFIEGQGLGNNGPVCDNIRSVPLRLLERF